MVGALFCPSVCLSRAEKLYQNFDNSTSCCSLYMDVNAPLEIWGHFGDESFQAIHCTGTDNNIDNSLQG